MVIPLEIQIPEVAKEIEQTVEGIWEQLELTEKVEILEAKGFTLNLSKKHEHEIE